MRRALRPHPDYPSAEVSQIEVDLTRAHDTLAVRYIVIGNIAAIRIPLRTVSTRADQLWRHTCFEVFMRMPQGAGSGGAHPYFEFNFSSSTEWAAYRFTDRRKGMAPLETAVAPNIQSQSNDTTFELAAALDLGAIAILSDAPLTLGLSVIIEETSSVMSYWALTHPKGNADFHHSDCFALTV